MTARKDSVTGEDTVKLVQEAAATFALRIRQSVRNAEKENTVASLAKINVHVLKLKLEIINTQTGVLGLLVHKLVELDGEFAQEDVSAKE